MDVWMPEIQVPPKSTQTRSGWRWLRVVMRRSREVMVVIRLGGLQTTAGPLSIG